MRNDLVAEEIEVNPLIAAAPFGAAEELAVERLCGIDVGGADLEPGDGVAGRGGPGVPSSVGDVS